MDNTAEFTAHAALDDTAPRVLKIAGSEISARELKKVASDVTGEEFRLFRPGGLGLLKVIIKIARLISPAKDDLYPAWQGMQYMHNMASGRAKLQPLDNSRYPGMRWTTEKDVLTEHLAKSK